MQHVDWCIVTIDIDMLWEERELQEIKELQDHEHLQKTTDKVPFSGELVISIMRRHSNRCNRPKSFDPKAMSFQDLQALPKKSLLLLALAGYLVTTGTKAQLAQWIFKYDNNSLPRQPAATVDQANIPLQPQNAADVEVANTS